MNQKQIEDLDRIVKDSLNILLETIVSSDELQNNPSHLLSVATKAHKITYISLLDYCLSPTTNIRTDYGRIIGTDPHLKQLINNLGIEEEIKDTLYSGVIRLKYELYEGFAPAQVNHRESASFPKNIRQKLSSNNDMPEQEDIKQFIRASIENYKTFVNGSLETALEENDRNFALKLQADDRSRFNLEVKESGFRGKIIEEREEVFKNLSNAFKDLKDSMTSPQNSNNTEVEEKKTSRISFREFVTAASLVGVAGAVTYQLKK